jgi:hypothetical protein
MPDASVGFAGNSLTTPKSTTPRAAPPERPSEWPVQRVARRQEDLTTFRLSHSASKVYSSSSGLIAYRR